VGGLSPALNFSISNFEPHPLGKMSNPGWLAAAWLRPQRTVHGGTGTYPESLAHVIEILTSNLLETKAKVCLDSSSNAAGMTNVLATQMAKGNMSTKQV
jgi:hypothetical protein